MNLFKGNFWLNKILCTNSQLTLKSDSRNYAFKSNLKIKWVRPEKIPSYKPEKSGDLKPVPEIDTTQFALEFQKSKELETADETVRKLFTLHYLPKYKTTRVYMLNMLKKVQRHPLDRGSTEATVAQWTAIIRTLQERVELDKRNVRLRVFLQELIDKRNKYLKYLRKWDYKRFEWLIDNLDIVYKPIPLDQRQVYRRDSLRKLTDKYCEDIKSKRLSEYRTQLANEQPVFLQEKINTLEFIRQEQIDCGVEVTVTQEEIDNVKKQLQDLKERKVNEEATV